MILKAIILGIIEGLTEFLPVSSTGHLILVNNYLDFTGDFANRFAIIVQMGAIFAVILYFWPKLVPKFQDKKDLQRKLKLWLKVLIGCVPAAIIGLTLEDILDKYLFNPTSVAIALIVGAVLILLVERLHFPVRVRKIEELSYKDAAKVGIFQCLALWPGMSRSASTIIGGLTLGLSRVVAAEFSFYLSIPILLGAGALKLLKGGLVFTNQEWISLLVGIIVSFIVAYLVIAAFMNYIKKHNFSIFAYYRIVLGILVLILV